MPVERQNHPRNKKCQDEPSHIISPADYRDQFQSAQRPMVSESAAIRTIDLEQPTPDFNYRIALSIVVALFAQFAEAI